MRLDLLAVGLMRGTPEELLVSTHIDRAQKSGRQIGLDGPYLHEIKERFKGNKWAPAFNAINTFLYTHNEVTHSGTHVKAADDIKRTMNTVIQALIPVIIFGIFNFFLL